MKFYLKIIENLPLLFQIEDTLGLILMALLNKSKADAYLFCYVFIIAKRVKDSIF